MPSGTVVSGVVALEGSRGEEGGGGRTGVAGAHERLADEDGVGPLGGVGAGVLGPGDAGLGDGDAGVGDEGAQPGERVGVDLEGLEVAGVDADDAGPGVHGALGLGLVVHLERVQFGLKNFDMVVIFKDFTRAPAHINTIPVESLDGVKDWLDSVDIPFSEGPLNLNWGTIMKTLIADPHAFFAEGGWSFLAAESDGESDEEEEESAFEMSEEDFASESESEEESNFDSEASAEASDDEVSEEEGEDWDELEKKAARKDREGGMDDEERKPKASSKKR